MDIVWLEQRYMDPDYKCDARFRVALARPAICLISMNYWSNRAAGLERVWDDVLRHPSLWRAYRGFDGRPSHPVGPPAILRKRPTLRGRGATRQFPMPEVQVS
jgi:hypothetical protein